LFLQVIPRHKFDFVWKEDGVVSPQTMEDKATFAVFLKENGIPEDAYDIKELSRFIRVNPKKSISKEEIEKQVNTTVQEVPWFPSFYKMRHDVPIASCELYKEGKIYGMDVSSGIVVHALDCQEGFHVLDLCCAPGTKFCMIADQLGNGGTLTGVDISETRLSSCKTVIKKYDIQNARLFLADGCTFSILAPSNDTNNNLPSLTLPPLESISQPLIFKSRKRKRRREHDLEGLYFSTSFPLRISSCVLYDRVLVDAECTLDASVRHILQYGKTSPHTPDHLIISQRKIILNGFCLLKPGGILVYSTCSFCISQNEDIVKYLLDTHSNARLIPIDPPTKDNIVPWDNGSLPHTVRFYPRSSGTSGMFIAKIMKVVS